MTDTHRQVEQVDLPPEAAFEEALRLLKMGEVGAELTTPEMRRALMLFALCREYARRTGEHFEEALRARGTVFHDEPLFVDRPPCS